jgi:hypothetical protein
MADPVQITQNQIGFAPEVAPFAQDVLGGAQALTSYEQNPYQKYTGEQVAQFSPLQQQSYDYAQQMTAAPQLQDATSLAGMAGLGGLNTQYTFKPSDFTADTAKGLMNPYLDVMDTAARRNAAISQQQLGAQAANAGAFGGSRNALMQAQANAELQRQLGQNQYNAFNQAQQQYNTQQQQNAQQQQFGASLGMQGLQTALQGANALGSLGQTQYAQNVGLVGLQNQLGLQQQQQAQNVLNTQYQNWAAEQNDPYKRLGFYSDIVRGAPLTQTGSSVYAGAPTGIQALTSLGLGAYGLNSLFGTPTTKAAGGAIKGYASGGSVLSPGFKDYAVSHIDPRQLPLAQQNAQARGDLQVAQDAQQQMAEDAAMRRGIAGAMPPGADVVRAAGGGIIAFAAPTAENNNSLVTSEDGEDDTDTFKADYRLGPADPALLRQASQRIGQMDTFKPVSMTPEEENTAWTGYLNRAQKALGPNEGAAGFRKYLTEADTDRAAALQQARGIGALKAASAVLEPGGLMRGLGKAGSAFADVYGQAQQADRKEKQSLAMAGFQLADAERKERLGLTKEADAALAAHKTSLKDANRFNFDKLRYSSDATVRLAQASRQLAPRGGAGGPKPKLAEDTAAMLDKLNTIKQNNPNWEQDPQAKLLDAQIKDRIALVGTGKEPLNKPAELANTLEAKITKDAETAWGDMNRVQQKNWAKEQGLDPKYLGTARDKYIENYKKTARPSKIGESNVIKIPD